MTPRITNLIPACTATRLLFAMIAWSSLVPVFADDTESEAPDQQKNATDTLRGGGKAANSAGGSFERPRLKMEGQDYIIKQSPEADMLWGYSYLLGKWTKLPIPKQKELLVPSGTLKIGTFRAPDRIYAYSSATGRWGELKTSSLAKFSYDYARVEDHGKIYIFSNVSGRWSRADDAGDNPQATDVAGNVPVESADSQLQDASGRPVDLENSGDDTAFEVVVRGTSERLAAADLLKQLKSRFENLERQVKHVAAEYRGSRQRLGENAGKSLELRSQLDRLVRETFDRRQNAQRLEAEILRHRLEWVDSRLHDRERLRDKIIDRRLQELANPSLNWETDAEREASQDGATPKGQPTHSASDSTGVTTADEEAAAAPDIESKKALDGSRTGGTRDDNELQMTLVRCPRGSFMMSTSNDAFGEAETANVTLTNGFWLGKYEVTQSEFERVMGKIPSNFSASGKGSSEVAGLDTSRFPAERVSWTDAMEFCRRLTERERNAGRLANEWEYTLPTEAQWEYACRAGKTGEFGFGDKLNGQQANCNGESPLGTDQPGPFLARTTAVGSYPPNAWGLCDMNGNVWEWCRDWFTSRIPLNDGIASSSLDPEITTEQDIFSPGRANRGGAWSSPAHSCRTVARDRNHPDSAYSDLGFRVALCLVQTRPIIDGVTVRELRADSILLEFAVAEPTELDEALKLKVRRQQVVCLRGVFPWPEQAARLAALAKNYPHRRPADALDIRDFKIERQEALGTPSTWDNIPWNAYPVSKSVHILRSCEDFDPDVIQEAERSAAITSPLPRLRNGTWDERALHPRLKENGLAPVPPRKSTDDVRAGAADKNETARYVLFRFFDFDTNDGRSYRYRVKLVFEFPDKRELQEGPWSEPSTVAVVGKPST